MRIREGSDPAKDQDQKKKKKDDFKLKLLWVYGTKGTKVNRKLVETRRILKILGGIKLRIDQSW